MRVGIRTPTHRINGKKGALRVRLGFCDEEVVIPGLAMGQELIALAYQLVLFEWLPCRPLYPHNRDRPETVWKKGSYQTVANDR